jgi:hypothetical protein
MNNRSIANPSALGAEELKEWFDLILELKANQLTPQSIRAALLPSPSSVKAPDVVPVVRDPNDPSNAWCW